MARFSHSPSLTTEQDGVEPQVLEVEAHNLGEEVQLRWSTSADIKAAIQQAHAERKVGERPRFHVWDSDKQSWEPKTDVILCKPGEGLIVKNAKVHNPLDLDLHRALAFAPDRRATARSLPIAQKTPPIGPLPPSPATTPSRSARLPAPEFNSVSGLKRPYTDDDEDMPPPKRQVLLAGDDATIVMPGEDDVISLSDDDVISLADAAVDTNVGSDHKGEVQVAAGRVDAISGPSSRDPIALSDDERRDIDYSEFSATADLIYYNIGHDQWSAPAEDVGPLGGRGNPIVVERYELSAQGSSCLDPIVVD